VKLRFNPTFLRAPNEVKMHVCEQKIAVINDTTKNKDMNSYFRENKIKNFKNEKWIQKTQSQEES
jgi:hypothetical protein